MSSQKRTPSTSSPPSPQPADKKPRKSTIQLTVSQKQAWHDALKNKTKSVKQFMDETGCSESTGFRLMRESVPESLRPRGRPKAVSDAQLQAIVDKHKELFLGKSLSTASQFHSDVQEAAKQTSLNAQRTKFEKPLSLRSVYRVAASLKAKSVSSQSTTEVRVIAEASVRSALSFAAVSRALITNWQSENLNDIDPRLQLNIDCTSVQLLWEADGKHILLPIADSDDSSNEEQENEEPMENNNSTSSCSSDKYQLPATHISKLHMAQFVRFFMTITASGVVLPPLFIIQDCKRIDPPQLISIQDFSANPNEAGFLYFCKSKSFTSEMYQILFDSIWQPYLARTRQSLINAGSEFEIRNDAGYSYSVEHPQAPSQNFHAMLLFDGDAKQLDAMMTDQMYECCTRSGLELMKTSASRTAVEQPCDVGSLFRTLKLRINQPEIHKKVAQFEDYFQLNALLYSVIRNNVHQDVSAEIVDQLSRGLTRVHIVMRESFTQQAAQGGWVKSGLYPYDFDMIMAQCTDSAELKHLFPEGVGTVRTVLFPQLVKKARLIGRITEEIFNELGFPGDRLKKTGKKKSTNIIIPSTTVPTHTTQIDNATIQTDSAPSAQFESLNSQFELDHNSLTHQRSAWVSCAYTRGLAAEQARLKAEQAANKEEEKEKKKFVSEQKKLTQKQQKESKKTREIEVKLMKTLALTRLARFKSDTVTDQPFLTQCVTCKLFQIDWFNSSVLKNEGWSHCPKCEQDWCPDHMDSISLHIRACNAQPKPFSLNKSALENMKRLLTNDSAQVVQSVKLDQFIPFFVAEHQIPVNPKFQSCSLAAVHESLTAQQLVLLSPAASVMFKPFNRAEPVYVHTHQFVNSGYLVSNPVLEKLNDLKLFGVKDLFLSSTIHYFNQESGVAAGHFNGMACWLYLQSGVKLWISTPWNCDGTPHGLGWKWESIVRNPGTRWCLQHAGQVIIIPSGLKHFVITPVASVAYSCYFNNSVTAIFDLSMRLAREKDSGLTNALKQFGIKQSGCEKPSSAQSIRFAYEPIQRFRDTIISRSDLRMNQFKDLSLITHPIIVQLKSQLGLLNMNTV